MDQGKALPPSTGPSTGVSWRASTRMTGCTASWLPSQGDPAVVHRKSVSAWVDRPLKARRQVRILVAERPGRERVVQSSISS
jgi:hypothetical protein